MFHIMKKLLTLFTACLLLTGCSDDGIDKVKPSTDSTERRTSAISVEDARQRLGQIIREINSQNKGAGEISSDMANRITCTAMLDKNENRLTRANEDEACFYVFELGNKEGFAIMGATPEYPELLAIGAGSPNFLDPTAELPDEDLWKIPTTDTTITITPSDPSIKEEGYPVRMASTYTTYGNGGLCKVKWGNNEPYNEYLPWSEAANGGGFYGPSAVGCAAIAIAQIMTVENLQGATYPGYEFDWPTLALYRDSLSVTSNPNVKHQICTLVKILGDSKNLQNEYTRWVSWAPISRIADTFSNFGLNCSGTGTDLKLDSCIYEIENGYPVYIHAYGRDNKGKIQGNHSWIAHGALKAVTPVQYYTSVDAYLNGDEPFKTLYETSWYLQMNWGWDGCSDGYYLMDNRLNTYAGPDIPEIGSDKIRGWSNLLTNTAQMIINIRKK